MGAQSSKEAAKAAPPTESRGTMPITSGPSVQVSPELLDYLASSQYQSQSSKSSNNNDPTLDVRIQAHIQAQVEKLRQQEEELQTEISDRLTRENVDLELHLAKDKNRPAARDAILLQTEIDTLAERLRNNSQNDSKIMDLIKGPRDRVVACYRNNPNKTLDCWKETEDFKKAVRTLEAEFAASTSK